MLPPDEPGLGSAEPVIATPGGRGMVPQVQLVSIVGRANGSTGAPERDAGRLRELVMGHAPGTGSMIGDDPQGPTVEPVDEVGDRVVSFSDVQAHEEDDRIDRLVERLRGLPGIEAAHREDREVLLVRSALDDEALQALVDRAWSDVDT